MKPSLRILFLSVVSVLSACATAPQQPASPAPHHADRSELDFINEPPRQDLPKMELTDRLLYEFLLGDIAAQRDRPELAAQAYLDLARNTRDPRVARRAAQLAYESRQLDQAVEAFQLWQELEPDTPLARQMLLSLLLSAGRLEEAWPHLDAILKADPANAGRTFLNIYPQAARTPDKAALLDWMMQATRAYPELAEGHWVVAQAAAAAGKHDLALAEAQRAAALKPEWDAAVVYEAELTLRSDPQRGLMLLKRYLDAHPGNADLRLYYARALLNQKQYAPAREEFQRLLQDRPDSPDMAFAIALISLQMGEHERAEKELQQALSGSGKEESAVHYYLGQLKEARKDDGAALDHYRQVKGGEHAYAARLREVALLDKAGRLDEARARPKLAVPATDQQRVQLILIDGQLLREGKQHEAAYKALAAGLDRFPGDSDLLYQTAMAAEKLKKNEQFEKLIRKLIKLEPDNAHAYNALGYSLMERKERLPEAMQLVEKAYRLAPDDAAIIDSMGWGYYLLGDLGKSVEFLRRAYAANPDPEIAAHLGEVLWKQGDKEGARKVWDEGAKTYPGHEILKSVIKRFNP